MLLSGFRSSFSIYHLLTKRCLMNRKVHGYGRVFSGIQPSGSPHLGNYFGAIQRWTELQKSGKDCIFSIVDMHSITLPQEPHTLRKNIQIMVACLLASGINPDLSTIFLQSQVPQHTELSWILGCLCTMTRLTHLPQYKEKSSQLKDIPLGIYIYPVLQCADILLYKATLVPVGEDQLQHIQLAQHFVKLFNNRFKKIFPNPEPLLSSEGARIKSLRKPDKKMSKSDTDCRSHIDLTDPPDVITEKVKKALTDFTSAVTYDPLNRPGVSNLILMHSLCTGLSPSSICEEYQHIDTGQYKMVVAEVIVEYLRPVQKKIFEYLDDPLYLKHIVDAGADKAAMLAMQTMGEVKEAVGMTIDGKIDNNLLPDKKLFEVS